MIKDKCRLSKPSLIRWGIETDPLHAFTFLFLAACHDQSGSTLNMNHDNDHCPIPTCSDKCLEHIKDYNKIKHKCNRTLFFFPKEKWLICILCHGFEVSFQSRRPENQQT